MGRNIYVGNLPFSVNKQTLQDRFSQCGMVVATVAVAIAAIAE